MGLGDLPPQLPPMRCPSYDPPLEYVFPCRDPCPTTDPFLPPSRPHTVRAFPEPQSPPVWPPLTGPLGASGRRKGRREGRERRPGAGLLTPASAALRGPGSGVGLWASANFPREGVWEFPDTLWQCIRPKKLGKAAKEPHLVGYTRFSLMGFSRGFPHTGGQERESQDGGVWQGERKGEEGCVLV